MIFRLRQKRKEKKTPCYQRKEPAFEHFDYRSACIKDTPTDRQTGKIALFFEFWPMTKISCWDIIKVRNNDVRNFESRTVISTRESKIVENKYNQREFIIFRTQTYLFADYFCTNVFIFVNKRSFLLF